MIISHCSTGEEAGSGVFWLFSPKGDPLSLLRLLQAASPVPVLWPGLAVSLQSRSGHGVDVAWWGWQVGISDPPSLLNPGLLFLAPCLCLELDMLVIWGS